MPNRLANETSPYLRQHADNPVDWYAWGDDAFARAKAEDRPVLLSVGYSACHWCHVMAHESFENPEIAALMNDLFVNIKVDREERPDVDSIYMSAVQAISGHGGWPMTAFLTPSGLPFFGGTYFPPEDRMGMRGFPTVLRAVADAYRAKRADVEVSGQKLRELLAPRKLPIATEEPRTAQLDSAARLLVQQTDTRHGGFGEAPKFPHPMAIDLLLRRFRVTGDRAFLDAAELTLDAMARGGINDQVGGGFHRYSVDERWAAPHFEKMLYDNAQLVPVYLHAYQLSDRSDFCDVVTRTLDYMARELRLASGGFAASQDADSPGGEGSFFVWTPTQLRDVLREDGNLAARVFGVVDAGNFEHGTTVLSMPYPLERVAASISIPVDELARRIDDIRARLYAARQARSAPARDDKVITAWNALAIRAFAEAGAALKRDDYLAIARHAAEFLLDAVVIDGAVLRTWKDGTAKITGFIEDVAHLADALLTLYESTGEPRFFVAAQQLAEQIVDRYRGGDGMYYDTAIDAAALIVRPRSIDDNPVTAGQSAAASAFMRLYGFTGEQRWRDRAMEIITPLAAAVERAPLALSGLAAAMELAVGPMREIAIAGDPRSDEARSLVDAVLTRFAPLRVLAWGDAADVPLLHDRPTVDGHVAAYVCEHFVCQAPVTDVASLQSLLSAAPAPVP